MELIINDKLLEVESAISIPQLLQSIGSPLVGVAVAVNDTMVPRVEWDSFRFAHRDNVLVIKAASGG
jgi:sulfur carrier protein